MTGQELKEKNIKTLIDNYLVAGFALVKKYKCNKCKDKIGAVICSCEVVQKYDNDYEEWKNK